MATPDYTQKVEDHQALLVLVRQVGHRIKNKTFNRIYDKISRVQCIRIPEQQRLMYVRYKRIYTSDDNAWGDFQAHRRIFGLICVGKSETNADLESLKRSFEYQKALYESTLFDSRLLIIGLDSDGNAFDKDVNSDHDGTLQRSRRRSSSGRSRKGSRSSIDNGGSRRSSSDNKNAESEQSHSTSPKEASPGALSDCEVLIPNSDITLEERQENSDSLQVSMETTGMNSSMILTMEEAAGGASGPQCCDNLSPNSMSPTESESSNTGSLDHKSSSAVGVINIQNTKCASAENLNSTETRKVEEAASYKEQTLKVRAARSLEDVLDDTKPRKLLKKDSLSANSSPNLEKERALSVWIYTTSDACYDIEDKLQEFLSHIFWVLESKRLDRALEKQDRMPLLMAPFEKKDLVGLDIEGRNYRKRCLGRIRKHMADLCLLAGLPCEAIIHYQTAHDVLKSCHDWLWLAATNEGLCSASVAIHYPQSQISGLKRNLSTCSKRGQTESTETNLKTGSVMTTGVNGLDLSVESRAKNVVPEQDIIDKYKEALTYYSKFRGAGIVAMEASIKACRVLVLQRKSLQAAEFLNNVVYINLTLTEDEKIQRYSTLALLYSQIGFHRKAAFFKRVAAMQCIAHQKPGWVQCYNLLLQSLDGYKIPLDIRKFPDDHTSGWPVIQHRVLHEIMYSARRMGNPAVAIRHMTFLLHTMLEHLTEQERKDISLVLEQYTTKCEASIEPITLENGVVLPPVHLTKLPTVCSFKPNNLPPHLRPVKKKSLTSLNTGQQSPFIYSPLLLNRNTTSKTSFHWVEDNVCEVTLQVCNPMPYELKITDMGLITEGVEFETYPANLSLPAESGPYPVKILGSPRGSGELHVYGYSTNVLGVKSFCLLKDMPNMKELQYTIDVGPALPQLQVTTSLPKSSSFSSLGDSANVVTSASVCLFGGENQECQVTMKNVGSVPVESVNLSLDSKLPSDALSKVYVWSNENLKSQLPISPGNQATLTIYIHGISDFLPPNNDLSPSPLGRLRNNRAVVQSMQETSEDEYPTKTIEALLRIQYSGGAGLKEDYCRQCSVAFNVEIQPSFIYKNWNVLPSDSPAHCFLVLDLVNITSHEVEISYNFDNSIILESKQCKRIALQVNRCSNLPSIDTYYGGNYSNYKVQELGRRYSRCLSEFVDIRWKMASTSCVGRLTIDQLTWTPDQLRILRTLPVQWVVCIDDIEYRPELVVKCRIGVPVSFLMTITNYSANCIDECQIKLQCYQDQLNGVHRYDLGDQIVYLGTTNCLREKIPINGSTSHECSVIFLHTGVYKVIVNCSTEEPPSDNNHTDVIPEEDSRDSSSKHWFLIVSVNVSDVDVC